MRALIIAAALSSTCALADEASRFYVHAGAGNYALPSLGAGYTLGRASLEAVYVDLGEVHSTVSHSGPDRLNEHWSARGAGARALYMLPLGARVSLGASAGAYRLRSTYTARSYHKPPLYVAHVKTGETVERSSETVGALGVAASYDLSQWLAVRLMLERIDSPALGVRPLDSFTFTITGRF